MIPFNEELERHRRLAELQRLIEQKRDTIDLLIRLQDDERRRATSRRSSS